MKKGFTLVEIIISIGLILLIGTGVTVGIIITNNKNNLNKLDEMSAEIYTAVQLLIETDESIKQQLYNNKNGVVVPLKKLQSEGLVDFKDIDIDDHHVLTMLASNNELEKCSGSLYNIGTWTVSDDDVIYICADNNANENIKQQLINDNPYVARGEKPNNYVIFDVITDTSRPVYFPEEDQDLWRIYTMDENNGIKLVYNRVIGTDNSKLFHLNTGLSDGSNTYYLFKSPTGYTSNRSRFSSNTAWTRVEIESADNALKKQHLKFAFSHSWSWIEEKEWFIQYNYYFHSGVTGLTGSPITSKIGTINNEEYEDTISNGKTWLPLNIILGIDYESNSCTSNQGVVIKDSPYGLKSYCSTNTIKVNGSTILTTFNGADFLPSIVLKKEVKLEKNTSCPANTVQGSKECPYRLSCSSC